MRYISETYVITEKILESYASYLRMFAITIENDSQVKLALKNISVNNCEQHKQTSERSERVAQVKRVCNTC